MNTKLTLATAALAIFASGCDQGHPTYGVDQERRERLFMECLDKVFASGGQRSTHYRDQTGVVGACDRSALSQSRYCIANCSHSQAGKTEE